MKIGLILVLFAVLFLGMWQAPAEAARNFTSVQTDPAPVIFTMRDATAVTFQITNTSTGGNTDERLYQVRFRISTYGTTFSNTTAAPAGWTRTAYSTTSITFRANTVNDAIVCTTGGCLAGPTTSKAFTLMITAGTSTVNVNQSLSEVRGYFSDRSNFSNSRSVTKTSGSSIGLWALRALRIISFQITDLAGAPISTLIPGTGFRLVMTIKNEASGTLSSITTNPNPPTANTGAWSGAAPSLTGTVYSPNPLTLASGNSGTITFTYSTNAASSGTINFTAFARNSANSATSLPATSTTLTAGNFTAGIVVATTPATSPACDYFNQDLTVTMTLTNSFGNAITGVTVTPAALTVSAPGVVTLISGPTFPSGTTVNGGGGTLPITWVYRITGPTSGPVFTFSGVASGTQQTGGAGTPRNTPSATSNPVTFGGFSPTVSPNAVNANSTNQELTWTITHNGCAHVSQVQITIPGGWVPSTAEVYSLIEQASPPNASANTIENVWGVSASGTNPVTFTAPASPPNPNNLFPRVTPTPEASFSLVFSSTPAAPIPSDFQITVTDVNGVSVTRSTPVTINNFNTANPSNPNANETNTIREQIP